jgi:hypothetical protein
VLPTSPAIGYRFAVSNDLNLDGVEISVLKALGFGGGDVSGEALSARVPELGEAELIDSLQTLVMMGYVVSDKGTFSGSNEFRAANFHVNSGYARELREAMNPRLQEKPKSRRVRRE